MNLPHIHFSVLLLSCRKAHLVGQAVESVRRQTHESWDLTIVDSGDLVGMLRAWEVDPRIKVIQEEPIAGKNVWVAPGPRLMNLHMGAMRGPWIMHLGDDDLLLENCMEDYATTIEFSSRNYQAYVGGQLRVACSETGVTTRIKNDHATNGYGVYCACQPHGVGMMDCRVDGMQFVFHKSLWATLRERYAAPWPEEMEHVQHADGLFMERAVFYGPAKNVEGVQTVNRRTPQSMFCGTK